MTAPVSEPTFFRRDEGGLAMRDYQREAFNKARDVKREGVLVRVLEVLPTGTGKTVIFAHIVRRTRGRVLILVHRDELVRQTIDKLHQVDPTLEVGVIKAERNDVDARVVVASVQTLSRQNRLAQVVGDFSLIIVDEAHHATADSYRRVLEAFGSFDEENPTFTIGFTATPERSDKINLKAVWQEIIFHRNILPMMRAGYLCDLKGKHVRLEMDMDLVKRANGDFQDGDLAEQMEKVNAPEQIVQVWIEEAAGRRTLVFTPTVAFAYSMAAEWTRRGYRADVVHANTPTEERQLIYRKLRSGQLDVIANCGVLTEGFDEPSVNCIVLARPTQSRPFYTQMVGRGTRLYPGKTDCLILDCSGASKRFELVTLAKLMDLTEDELDGSSVLEAAEKRDAAMAALEERVAAQGKVIAETVDLFNRKSIHWVQTNDGGFVVSVMNGHIAIQPDGDTYRVTLKQRIDGDNHFEALAENVTIEYGLGIAEDVIRARGWGGLVKADAVWRKPGVPASQSQLALLDKLSKKYHFTFDRNLNKSDASDLITKTFAEHPLPPKRRW